MPLNIFGQEISDFKNGRYYSLDTLEKAEKEFMKTALDHPADVLGEKLILTQMPNFINRNGRYYSPYALIEAEKEYTERKIKSIHKFFMSGDIRNLLKEICKLRFNIGFTSKEVYVICPINNHWMTEIPYLITDDINVIMYSYQKITSKVDFRVTI